MAPESPSAPLWDVDHVFSCQSQCIWNYEAPSERTANLVYWEGAWPNDRRRFVHPPTHPPTPLRTIARDGDRERKLRSDSRARTMAYWFLRRRHLFVFAQKMRRQWPGDSCFKWRRGDFMVVLHHHLAWTVFGSDVDADVLRKVRLQLEHRGWIVWQQIRLRESGQRDQLNVATIYTDAFLSNSVLCLINNTHDIF